ncbi:type II toxin-antitoxin system VapC family toxin [Anatilimnocola sp. NA78]|uniref:type II toxin-antitoxin system VapC family toxin n=1 Tax=Anatilimnocola sp. NA78 TaxID=3415683 RepID=UPI003CE5B417
MLCDTGPLVALVLRTDEYHSRAVEFVRACVNVQFITTWSCFTEAMYMVGRSGGWTAQDALFRMVEQEVLDIHESRTADSERMKELMSKYRDAPMDFADASLISAAENLDEATIFTFDSHFRFYLLNDQTPVNVVP